MTPVRSPLALLVWSRSLLLPVLLPVLLLGAAGCPPRQVVVEGIQYTVTAEEEDAATKVLREAREAQQEGNWRKVERKLIALVENYPRSPQAREAHHTLALMRTKELRWEDVVRHAEAYLDVGPIGARVDSARYLLGQALYQLERIDEAGPLFAAVQNRLEEPEQQLLVAAVLGELAWQAEDWARALDQYSRFYALTEREDERVFLFERAMQIIDARASGIEVRELWETLGDERFPGGLLDLKLARLYYHVRDYDQCEEFLARFLERYPEHPLREQGVELRDRIEARFTVAPGRVGVLLPLSGKYRNFGEQLLVAIQMAAAVYEERSDKRIELAIRDSEGDPLAATRAVEELVFDEHVIAIIGPMLQSTAEPAARKSEELSVPMISLSRREGLAEIGPHVFRTFPTNSAQAEALAELAVNKLGLETFAVVFPRHPYGQELSAMFWDALSRRQAAVTAIEAYEQDETTFGTLVKRLVGRENLRARANYREARMACDALEERPYIHQRCLDELDGAFEAIIDFDAVFIPDNYRRVSLLAPAIAAGNIETRDCLNLKKRVVTRGFDQHKVRAVCLIGPGAWHHPQLVERGERFVEGSVFVDGFFAGSHRPEVGPFVSEFRTLIGRPPNVLEAHAFDAMMIARQLIEDQQVDSRAAFRDALRASEGFAGVTGDLTFDEAGEGHKELVFLTVEKQRIREFDPAEIGPLPEP